MFLMLVSFFFFKQKTAYEMRISDWSSDVCSSDLKASRADGCLPHGSSKFLVRCTSRTDRPGHHRATQWRQGSLRRNIGPLRRLRPRSQKAALRSEEHTSELQSLMRISYAVFCLNKKQKNKNIHHNIRTHIITNR